MNYDIVIIENFKIGDIPIPFRFDIAQIGAFYGVSLISSNDSFKKELNKESIKDMIFKYFYHDGFDFMYSKELCNDYILGVDYEFNRYDKAIINIKSKDLFYELFFNMGGDLDTILKIKEFITENESAIIKIFINRLYEDLDYRNISDLNGNYVTHILCSLLGDTSVNPTPFFKENLGKSIQEWSFREIQLRAIYRSKVNNMEIAKENDRIKRENKAIEDAKQK